MTIYPVRRSIGPFVWFVGGVLSTLLLTLVGFWLVMQPSTVDLWLLGVALGVAALAFIVAGFLAYRLAWIQRLQRARSTIFAGYTLASLLISVAIGLMVWLMVPSAYDRGVVTVLLIFGLGSALAFGYLHAATHSIKLDALVGAADAITLGRFHVQVEIEGAEQLAQMAAVFNTMSAKLELVDRKERQLDQLRRDLMAWISYDLRIPLGSARTRVEALAGGHFDNQDTYLRYLRMARRDINALSDLVDDLSDMAQVDVTGIVIDRQPSKIAALIAETVAGLTDDAAEKGVSLTGTAAPGIAVIALDARQISRVLNNLAGHALNRTPAGGSVRVNAYPTRAGVLLEVADFFEGTRPDEMVQILEMFFGQDDARTHATANTRLSLAMASAIVQAHGSRIRAESIAGKGLRLVFTLAQDPDAVSVVQRGM